MGKTPEEKFDEQVWEVLKKIREEKLATEKEKPVEYRFPNFVGVGIIPKSRQKKILHKLQEWKAFKIREDPFEPPESTPYLYYLDLIQPKFDEIYKKYEPESSKPANKPKQNESVEIIIADLISKYSEIKDEKDDKRFYKALRIELEEVMQEQGQDIPSRIRALKDRKKAIEVKMDSLEDQMISKTMPQERVKKKYIPLRDELKSIEADIVKLNKPSASLTKTKIDKIIKFLKQLPKLYKAFNEKQRKQFLRWFVAKIWVKDKKLSGFTYTDTFKILTDLRLVRISDLWLPLKDLFCNHKLEFDFTLDELKIFASQFNQQAQYQFLRA